MVIMMTQVSLNFVFGESSFILDSGMDIFLWIFKTSVAGAQKTTKVLHITDFLPWDAVPLIAKF